MFNLGRIAQCRNDSEVQSYCDNYNQINNEIFFNQRYRNFIDILDFYRSGNYYLKIIFRDVNNKIVKRYKLVRFVLTIKLLF